MLGITLGVSDISNPDVDEGSGLFLSGVSLGFTWIGDIESVVLGEGDTLGNL